MDQHDTPDPFTELKEWAEKTERRVTRDRRRRLMAGRAPVVLVGAAALVVLGLAVPAVRSMLPDAPATSAYPIQSAPPGITVTTSRSAAPTDPYAGTPAATYPKGEAGISLPKASAVMGFTAAQVDAAVHQVRKALIAGRLDQKMLISQDPATFLGLLAPGQRPEVRKWFSGERQTRVATWISPAARLDPREQPRVSGRMTVGSAMAGSRWELRVTTNYIWVYAFTDAVDSPLVAVHDQTVWKFPAAANLRPADRGMWIGDTDYYLAWMDCTEAAKGLLAPGAAVVKATPTEPDNAILRADHTLDIADDCH